MRVKKKEGAHRKLDEINDWGVEIGILGVGKLVYVQGAPYL